MAAIYYFLHRARQASHCAGHLKDIYRALELYELERGTLPNLAFFPDDPKQDPNSLRVVLESHGLTPDQCACPAAPRKLQDLGLTYVWNVRMSNRKLEKATPPPWLLVEIQSLSADVPVPHPNGYNVLFSDGSVQCLRQPLKELQGL